MPNTPKGITYPSNSSPVAVPADLQELATDVDGLIVPNTGGTYTGSVSFTQSPSVPTPTSGLHAVNKTYADAINADVTALETELGANPSGTFSTVVSRLDSYTTGFNNVGNLLTANQAKPTTAGAYTLSNVTEGAAGVFTASDSGDMIARALYIPNIVAGETYTAVVRATVPARYVRVGVLFRDAPGGNTIGGVVFNNATYDFPLNGTGTASLVTVAPAGATSADLYTFYSGGGAGGDVITVHNASFHKGTGGQWAMPGTPIVGGSHIATNGAVHLSGTGSPEGVVTAAPGSTWLQTDATTDVKGWIRWIKASGTGNTGWQVGAEADTGWRSLLVWTSTDTFTVGTTPDTTTFTYEGSGQINIRRVGAQVYLRLASGNIKMATGSSSISTGALVHLPSGFQSGAVTGLQLLSPGFAFHASTTVTRQTNTSLPSAGNYMPGTLALTFLTSDTWPSSLPGSAA